MWKCGSYFVIGLAYLVCSLKADEFDYEHQAKWYDQFKECSMNHQSPIELNTNSALLSYDIPTIAFEYYDKPYAAPAITENNGHTANIQLPKPQGYTSAPELWQTYDKLMPHISGGPLPAGRFVAESVHFHWGSKDSHGSEHVIDTERFSMEMHVVHRNSKYPTVLEAREHPDGLAVLAVLYSVNSTFVRGFAGLNSVIRALAPIAEFNKTSEIANFTLSPLLGDLDRAEFYTYEGSLTTPPCSQAVTWIVFSHVIPISHLQMVRFHSLSDGHGEVLENNYRSLQAKGERRVTLRKKRQVIDSEIESPLFKELIERLKQNGTAQSPLQQQETPTNENII